MSARRLELPITGALAGIKVGHPAQAASGPVRHGGAANQMVTRRILVDGARVNTRFCPQEGQVLSVRLSDPERRSGILPPQAPGYRL